MSRSKKVARGAMDIYDDLVLTTCRLEAIAILLSGPRSEIHGDLSGLGHLLDDLVGRYKQAASDLDALPLAKPV